MQSRINNQSGLTTKQAKRLYDQGLHNNKRNTFTKSIPQILQGNTFTLFNFINIVLAAMVFYTGDYKNLLFLVIAISNTIIGSIQEIRSKLQLDKMAILSQGLIRVVRDGQIKKVEADHIVLGDVLLIGHGDQIPIDGKVLTSASLQVDESQITGETNSIEKYHGDVVTSGSVVLSGSARIVATEVGEGTFVNRMEFEVSRTKKDSDSKMLKTINKIIKWLTFVIVPLGALLLYTKIMRGDDIDQAMLGTVAAMIGMIPEGLVLLSSVTLAVSAAKLARHKVLVRELPAIETLARVDTICLDKTGTITSGNLKFEDILPFNHHSKDELKRILGSLVYAFEDDNETSLAIKKVISNPNVNIVKSFPFSSDKKWSGVDTEEGNFIMGAPQFIIKSMRKEVSDTISEYANQGYRVLALLQSNKEDLTEDLDLDDAELLGLILISDEIRSDAKSTLQYFVDQGVDLKVISGDDPKTVSAIAKRVGLKDSDKIVDMTEVSFDADYQELVKENVVFGRVTPQQKKRLIRSYQLNGNTVAMTGDGVNDMLAMKQANCGIAMASGSESTKGIADFVLINSNFSAMIDVLAEGRRVINNIGSVASLYLIKTMFSLSLTILFMFSIHSYPFQPIQLTPINTFMVGLPSFLLALAPNYQRVTNQFSAKIYNIALPAAITIVGYVVLIIYIGNAFHFGYVQRATISVLVTGFVYWIALFKASRPLSKVKISIIVPSIVIFAAMFLFFPSVFSLVNVFKMPIFIPASLVVVTSVPVFIVMSSIVRRILIKINPKKFEGSI